MLDKKVSVAVIPTTSISTTTLQFYKQKTKTGTYDYRLQVYTIFWVKKQVHFLFSIFDRKIGIGCKYNLRLIFWLKKIDICNQPSLNYMLGFIF